MLQHYPSTIVVFQSTEYKNFIMINGNRPLNTYKIDRIIKEIEKGNDMLQYYPIQVRVTTSDSGDKLEILDGQHRFFICQKLKRPVHYILINEAKTMSDIAKVNSNVEKWTSTNFINCYMAAKNKNYELINQFIELYGLPVGITLVLLSTGIPGNDNGKNGCSFTTSFQEGTFVVTNWEEAVEFMEMSKQFSKYKNWQSRTFLVALHRIQKASLVRMEDLSAAVNKNVDMLSFQANYKDYLASLERIMNVGKHKRVIIV